MMGPLNYSSLIGEYDIPASPIILYSTSEGYELRLYNGSSTIAHTEILLLNTSYTVTISRTTSSITLYVNGIEKYVVASTNNIPMYLYSIFGRRYGCYDLWGYLKNVRFFNRAITITEAQLLAKEI